MAKADIKQKRSDEESTFQKALSREYSTRCAGRAAAPQLLRGIKRRRWKMASKQRTELQECCAGLVISFMEKLQTKEGISMERSKAATGSACYSG